jgi:phosphatidylinositol glycan class B
MHFLANFRENTRFRSDPDWRRFVTRWSCASLVLILITSYFSYGFFEWGEHYIVTEYVGLKLGKTPASELIWEYPAEIRAWFQPAIYYAAAKGLLAVGIKNPFVLAHAFRLISALWGWAAITLLMLAAGVLFPDNTRQRVAVILLALLWLIPYLAVRTTAEESSGAFLTIGLALLLLGSAKASNLVAGAAPSLPEIEPPSPRPERWHFPATTMFIAGISFGLAFEFRFQSAIAALGIIAWICCFSGDGWWLTSRKLGAMVVGGMGPLVVGTLLDRWGYGHWTCVPWNLFHVDFVQGMHSKWGVSPPWRYITETLFQPAAPMTWLWVVAMAVTWIRFPRHIITWTTLPFFIFHSMVGHKELRYLFPIVLPATLAFVLAYVPAPGKLLRPAFLQSIWDRRGTRIAKLIYGLNLFLLAVNCLTNKQPNLEVQRFIYDRYPNGCTLYIVGAHTKSPYECERIGAMYFYRPPNFAICRLGDYGTLQARLAANATDSLILDDRLSEDPEQRAVVPTADLLYRTYPTWVAKFNYLHWMERSKHYSLYAAEGSAIAAVPRVDAGSTELAGRPAADLTGARSVANGIRR